MRHLVAGKKLNRDYDHRRALLKNLARSFFSSQGKLKTTLAKAKAVQNLIERMITRAKKGDLASRRWLYRYFQDQKRVNQIVETFGKQFKDRPGGYTRIVKLKHRRGDQALIVRLELVEDLKVEEEKKEEKSKKKGKGEKVKPKGKEKKAEKKETKKKEAKKSKSKEEKKKK